MYASGGDVWNKGNLAISKNGSDWSVDSLTNKSIFALYATENTLYGVGTDGYIFSGTPDLSFTRTRYWGMLRSFASSPDGFVTAGGKDFNKGWIYQLNEQLKVDTAHTFENEILGITCNDRNQCVACGYGIILSSGDQGNSWQRSSQDGDYYNSVAVNSRNEFIIVGYNGSILRSMDDEGQIWEEIKNGHSPLANNKPFRKIKFDDRTGVIVGDNGLIWRSDNDGQDWKDISIDTELDLYDFVIFQSHLYCVSESGVIFKVAL